MHDKQFYLAMLITGVSPDTSNLIDNLGQIKLSDFRYLAPRLVVGATNKTKEGSWMYCMDTRVPL